MASLPLLRLPSSTSHHHQNPNPLFLSTSKRPLKPYLPFKPKPHLHSHASLNPNPNPKTHPLLSALSLAAAAAAAAAATAAAVSLLRFPSPSLATTITTSTSTSTSEQQQDAADDVSSLRALLEAKVSSGELAGAVAVADRLLSLCPGDADLRLLKAHLQARFGDITSARGAFEALLDKDPLKVEAYHGLVMAAAESDRSGAGLEQILKRIDNAMEICKKEGRRESLRDFKLLLAQILVMGGDYEESLKIYEDLVSEEPGDFRPYLCEGIIYSILGKKDAAEKQFEEYRRLVPDGHPYAQFFDKGVATMKVLGQMEEEKRQEVLKN